MFKINLADSLFISTVKTKEIHKYNRLSVNLKALNKNNEDGRDCYLFGSTRDCGNAITVRN